MHPFINDTALTNAALIKAGLKPIEYSKSDRKVMKICAGVNIALLAGVIALTPYMKSEEKNKTKETPKTNITVEPVTNAQDTTKTIDFSVAAKAFQNKTR